MASRLALLSQNLLLYAYSPSNEVRTVILKDILTSARFFAVAKEGTTREDWERRHFAAYINDTKELILFLSADEAILFARRKGIELDGQPMIMKATRQTISTLMMEYYESGLISSVRIYAISPLYLHCTVQEFIGVAQKGSTGQSPDKEGMPEQGQRFLEVDRIRTVLNTYDNGARRKLDPAGRCENVHQLIETLLMRNSIEPSVLDEKYNFAPGFTRNFCQSIVDSNSSKETLRKMLEYFDLAEYLYLFKGYSRELMEELKNNPSVDVYSLRPSRPSTKETFTLKKIQRGKDDKNGAFVYGMTLEGKHRQMRIVLSSPLGYTIGKSYEIVGLEPLVEENDPKGVTRAHEVRHDEEGTQPQPEPAEDGIVRPTKPGKQLGGTPGEQKQRQDFVIGFFRETDGINYPAALEKYKVLVEDPDVLDAFYHYIKDREFGFLARRGYSPKQLIREYHYPPFEAFCIMIKLQDDPDRTITMLKHRKNEPQYQKRSVKTSE